MTDRRRVGKLDKATWGLITPNPTTTFSENLKILVNRKRVRKIRKGRQKGVSDVWVQIDPLFLGCMSRTFYIINKFVPWSYHCGRNRSTLDRT